MNSRTLKLTRSFMALCLLGLLASCQDTIPKRSTITPGAKYDPLPTCDEGQDLVEVDDSDEEPATGNGSSGDSTDDSTGGSSDDGGTANSGGGLFAYANGKTYECKDKPVVRPDGAVFWKPTFCACKDSKAVSYGNCASFCSGRNTGNAETLFATFTVTEAISLGGLGNVYGWCNANLETDIENPECLLQLKDDQGNVSEIKVVTSPNSNSITANIQDKMAYDKTYVLTLVEKTSGAKSDSVQMVKFSSDLNLPILGPLKNAPISQFTCIVRDYTEDTATGDLYSEDAFRLHFYFVPRLPPKPIPPGSDRYVCHDFMNPLYGLLDQELYPRLELIGGVFNLWDTTDPRFYDNNGNKIKDVNEAIVQKTKSFGAVIPSGTEFFQPFTWMGPPQSEEDAGNKNSSEPLGYFMAPWIDQTTYKSYCLNASHYNSTNPLFKAMRDIIGVDTEGLYVGVRSSKPMTDSEGKVVQGQPDLILIRETNLKKVWFYLKNGVPTVPTDENVANVAVFFYYPLNEQSPYVQASTQDLYRVHSATELNALFGSGGSVTATSGSTSGGATTAYPPHDRKLGCIPKF